MDSDCIRAKGAPDKNGYGRVTRRQDGRNKQVAAHRWEWIEKYGPIDDRTDINHLCGNRACININHLEACSRAENLQYRTATKSKTGFLNVYKQTSSDTFVVRIMKNGLNHQKGGFATAEAANAYAKTKRGELFGGRVFPAFT